ncbi:MAG: DEAD/DEAH box helicase [bacterium]|nr:DEAD/DEAH box helicase [bacterium]
MTAKESDFEHIDRSSASGGLDTPIQFCPGVGPRRAQLLEKMAIYTVRDLLWRFPRGYEDYQHVSSIAHLAPGGAATVIGEVIYVEARRPRGKSRVRHILQATVRDPGGELEVVWFNQHYLADKVRQGARLRLHGKVDGRAPFFKMSSPKLTVLGEDGEAAPGGIQPLYPLTEGLTQNVVRKIARSALERFSPDIVEWIPAPILEQYGFPARAEAFRVLHAPRPDEGAPVDSAPPEEGLLFDPAADAEEEGSGYSLSGDPARAWERARRRLVFEEFLLHQYSLRRVQGEMKQIAGMAHPAPVPDPFAAGEPPDEWTLNSSDPLAWPACFIRDLPFELTAEQKKVCLEFQADMLSGAPMNRLLQGDVGSGKTVVSIYAMVLAAAGGSQAAMMVPTEILARQHAASLRRFTQSIPALQSVVLTGAVKGAERREILNAIKTGAAQLVIGTHALFQEGVEFNRLGLVVVDEQHKFGVEQRERLIEKGEHPDLIAATATPIPRTLSLTVFGDMDVSMIATLPPGRPPVITRWTQWFNERKVWGFVDEKLALGQQAYIVCPAIEPSEAKPDLPSTEAMYERIASEFLPHRRIAMLHGKQSNEEKDSLMNLARGGELDALVATTVIEVGVDLPNATLMVVLGADRFGLAQLHQLRGRVGRGTEKSYCILITPEQISPIAEQRMRLMEKTRDGFVIAEEDLRLRGPGEAFGARQSGHVRFHLADPLRDAELLRDAHQCAQSLYRADPGLADPAHQPLKQEIDGLYGRMEARRPS